jgi:hypothetical protein
MPLVPEAFNGGSGVFSHIHPGGHHLRQLPIVIDHVSDFDVRLQRVPRLKDSQDHFLAAVVVRMGFAGIDDLDPAAGGGDVLQSIQVAEYQVTPLVGSVAPGEPDRQVTHLHARVGDTVDVLDELPRGLVVRLP